jgi:hypothetical protein
MRRLGGLVVAGLLTLSMATAAPPSFAQSDENRASARALAEQGVQAMTDKRWADAVDLLTRAESLLHAPTFLLYLGRSYAQLGKLVEAQEVYTRLVRESLVAGAPKAFVAAQTEGEKELEALRPRLPLLTIQVPGALVAVAVTMDGVPVPMALIGVAHPVDPGDHKLQATASGSDSGIVPVTIKEATAQTVTLSLQPVAPAQGARITPAAPALDTALTPALDTASPPPSSPGLRTTGFVSGGIAVVGLAMGTVFAIESHSKVSDSQALCPRGTCTAAGSSQASTLRSSVDSLNSQATTFGEVSTTGFIVGGVAAAAAVTLLLLGNRHPSEPAAVPVSVWVAPGSAGIVGRF